MFRKKNNHWGRPMWSSLLIIAVFLFALCACGNSDEQGDIKEYDASLSEQPSAGLKEFIIEDQFIIPLPEGYEANSTYYKDVDDDEAASISFHSEKDKTLTIQVFVEEKASADTDKYAQLKNAAQNALQGDNLQVGSVETPVGTMYYSYDSSETKTILPFEEDPNDTKTSEVCGMIQSGDYYITVNMEHFQYNEEEISTVYEQITEKEFNAFIAYVQSFKIIETPSIVPN